MKIKNYILITFLLLIVSPLWAQKTKGDYSKKQRQVSTKQLLEEAYEVKEKNPKQAINLLEQVIRLSAKSKRSRGEEGRAYFMLGNIFEDIDQAELALSRYEQALPYFARYKKSDELSQIYYRMGSIHLNANQTDQAEINFTLCIENSSNKKLSIQCKEGLADTELRRGNNEASLSQIDSIQRNYELDSVAQARLYALQSQNFVQQNRYSEATQSYSNSVQNIPRNQTITQKEIEPVQRAQDDLLSFNNVSTTEKLKVSSNSLALNSSNNISSDVVIEENLKIINLYDKENDIVGAEKFIIRSKEVIDKDTKAASVAEVYKKSYDLNRKKGKMDEAMADLDQYIAAKENAIAALEDRLKKEIDIVQGQQQIDLTGKDLAIEEKDRALLESQLNTQKILIGFLILLLLGSLIFFYFLYKNVKAKRKANQLLLLKSLRTQMNPHFIFNALNSVNNFIAKNDEKAANKFLSDFSHLMRKVLDYSQRDFISFEEEMELNQLYLKLEHFRFRDRFEYTFQNNRTNQNAELEVPPMLIQPFIENAVWHGLRYKETTGHLSVQINDQPNHIEVRIEDDGIGRKKSTQLKTTNQKKYKSTGLENVNKRLQLINEIYDKNYEISVQDLSPKQEETGTLVIIKIPYRFGDFRRLNF